MGFELDRLMRQYGVSTAALANYAGAPAASIPSNPTGARPTIGKDADGQEKASDLAARDAYDKQKSDYDAYVRDPAAFNEAVRKYQLDQRAYDTYKNAYQNRVQSTQMYNQPQFVTNPNASRPQGWTDTIKAPTYGAIPQSFEQMTPEQKAQYYLEQRNIGYTDADLRAAAAKTFGTAPRETDWADLSNRAYRNAVQNAYQNIGRSGFGEGVTNIDAPGYNYWLNQVSSGAVKPGDLNSTILTAADTWRPGTQYDANKVPSQFDWGYYVNQYPDLANAGIDSMQEARRHYATIGQAQGRSPYEGWTNPSNANGQVANYAEGGEVEGLADKYNINDDGYYVDAASDMPALVSSPIIGYPAKNTQSIGLPVPPVPSGAVRNGPVTNLPVPPIPASAKNTLQLPAAIPAPIAPQPTAASNAKEEEIKSLLSKYTSGENVYAPELKAAREKASKESEAFAQLLQNALSSPEDAQNSKAEMYFRLAAAFGSPTKTGQFSENLAQAGKEMGEYAKGKRESAREKLALQLKAQELRSGAAKEDLATLRTLSAEEMKEKRAVATQLIKDYVSSGKPQSSAGKQALDEGLQPGTPEFQARVAKIAELNVEKQMASINAALSNVAVAKESLNLNQQKFENQKAQQSKLTGPEMTLKTETEDQLGQTEQGISMLKRALELNPNTFDNSLIDSIQYKTLAAAGSKDPKVTNTGELLNLLAKGAISQLKSTFPGAISNEERKALLALQGAEAKNKDERAVIMKAALKALQAVENRSRKRLQQINQGKYRETQPSEGTE